MKMLIYIGDLITDMPGIYLGEKIARSVNAEVTLLHIAPKENSKKQERKEGQAILDQVIDQFNGLNVRTRVRRGRVAMKLLEEVQENQHDMVVITSSRIGGYPRKLAVGREILPKMPCCTLIVKNPRPEINRILMLTGGLRISESMIEIGARLACSLKAKVTLMHVTANVPSMYTGLGTIEETLEEMLRTDTPIAKHLRHCAGVLDRHNVPSELKLKHGEPVYEIVREVDREDYDLIIIGASGATTSFKEWFLRNVTKDVIDLVGIPVMVVNQVFAQQIPEEGL
jgi:nucleotide-binding universal stress UspA family protein